MRAPMTLSIFASRSFTRRQPPDNTENSMKRNRTSGLSSFAALCGIAAAALGVVADAQAATQIVAERPPLSARKPEAVVDLQSTVRQTAAIVEGTVARIDHDYSEAEGPWTRVTLADVKAHFGNAPDTLELRHFGGPLPNGRAVVAAELPAFVAGKRYVVFLRNTAWNLSPVVGELALRAESFGGREVLVNSDGLAVTGIGKRGVEFGSALFENLPFDGSAPKALKRSLAAMPHQPLDRNAFVQAMASAVSTNGLAVGGTFYGQPAGEFKWRANGTSPRPGMQMPAAAQGSTAAPEVDASRPN
jgi:hypothetical protein